MTRRYFAKQLPSAGGIVTLDEAESHHAIKVMRIKPREVITLFDGIGNECEAVVESLGRRDVTCLAERVTHVDRENSISVTLGVAMPKGDRSKELIERLTELGVNRLVPLHCQRTQWPVPENAIQKWQRVVIDACKQSQRNHLMQILPPQNLESFLKDLSNSDATHRVIVHPCKHSIGTTDDQPANQYAHACAMIGPEGGFTDDEVALATENRWQTLDLGNRIYRIETAAILTAIKLAKL